jgi:NAD(P)-dependent dehydrogenase (short-subunit alcohol dehydrogenase family)
MKTIREHALSHELVAETLAANEIVVATPVYNFAVPAALKAWIDHGSASGLGRNIAEAVLASGDRLVATARDPRRLEDLVKKYGDQVRTAALDVADEDAARAAVHVAMDAFGRLDVVVNNAGYGDVAPFEQLSSERFKAVVDTNFMASSS